MLNRIGIMSNQRRRRMAFQLRRRGDGIGSVRGDERVDWFWRTGYLIKSSASRLVAAIIPTVGGCHIRRKGYKSVNGG